MSIEVPLFEAAQDEIKTLDVGFDGDFAPSREGLEMLHAGRDCLPGRQRGRHIDVGIGDISGQVQNAISKLGNMKQEIRGGLKLIC